MPHRLFEHIDSVVIGLLTLVATISAQTVTSVEHTEELTELRILMVPLVSSLIATGGLYLFNIGREPRNVIMGRAVFALLFGSSFIPMLAIVFPAWEPILRRAIILLPGGATMSMVFFFLSYPFSRALNNRSRGLADNLLDEAERRTGISSRKQEDEP